MGEVKPSFLGRRADIWDMCTFNVCVILMMLISDRDYDIGTLLLSAVIPIGFEAYRSLGGIKGSVGQYNLLLSCISLFSPESYLFVQLIISLLSKTAGVIDPGWNSALHSVTEHSAWGLITSLNIEVFGTVFDMQYISDINFNIPPRDSLSVEDDLTEIIKNRDMAVNFQLSIISILTTLGLSWFLGWQAALLIMLIVLLSGYSPVTRIDAESTSKDEVNYPENYTLMNKRNGAYRLRASVFGSSYHRGIGYLTGGTLYTRYHVTSGNPIDIGDGHLVYPSYINRLQDKVAYGKAPHWAGVEDGEEVLVGLASQYSESILTYRTQIAKDDKSRIIFRGVKSMPGCSGSPVFRERTTIEEDGGISHDKVVYDLVGTIGWYTEDVAGRKTTGIEILPHTESTMGANIETSLGAVQQIFMHPGAGKTRKIMPTLIGNGMSRYPKVYVSGPTKAVCKELYLAIESMYPGRVAFMSSAADAYERGSSARPIIIAAHNTMISMLFSGHSFMRKKGLWVLDEAHFMNTGTLFLKNWLRFLASKSKVAVVEMTATGYHLGDRTLIIKDGSNHAITDIDMEPSDMIEDIIQKSNSRKSIVFVTGIQGGRLRRGQADPTIYYLKKELEKNGTNVVELTRATFNTNYTKAKEMTRGVVLTTDISECGVNIEADVVYDFQESWKPVVHGKHVDFEKSRIDLGQRTQRRGRIGRTKPGEYISPGYNLPAYSANRAEMFDLVVFCNSMELSMDDEITSAAIETDLKLTPQQIVQWVSTSEEGINSAWLVNMLFDHNGRPRTANETRRRISEWIDSDDISVRVAGKDLELGFWDARDSKRLETILEEMLVIDKKMDRPSITTVGRKLYRNVTNYFKIFDDVKRSDVAMELETIQSSSIQEDDDTMAIREANHKDD